MIIARFLYFCFSVDSKISYNSVDRSQLKYEIITLEGKLENYALNCRRNTFTGGKITPHILETNTTYYLMKLI